MPLPLPQPSQIDGPVAPPSQREFSQGSICRIESDGTGPFGAWETLIACPMVVRSSSTKSARSPTRWASAAETRRLRVTALASALVATACSPGNPLRRALAARRGVRPPGMGPLQVQLCDPVGSCRNRRSRSARPERWAGSRMRSAFVAGIRRASSRSNRRWRLRLCGVP